jgi:nucleotide-binding universal stress UspA family protein
VKVVILYTVIKVDMKKILVPTDFSSCSRNAFKAAIHIANKTGAVIDLVHVYDRPVVGFVDLNIDHKKNKTVLQKTQNAMTEMVSSMNTDQCSINTHILADIPLTEILDQKKFKDIDLVVMGSQGAEGIKELFVGSNTEKVVRKSKIPILSLKEDTNIFDLKNIVVASNFYKELEGVFKQIDHFLKAFDPHFSLLKVVTPGNFETSHYSRKIMEKFADEFQLEDYSIHIYNDNSIEAGILNFAKDIDADAIVIATHGRKGIEHFINGSLAEDVVNHAITPVLSFKLKEAKENDSVLFPEK